MAKAKNGGAERPEGVPAEAVWNDGDSEWELAEKDADGKSHGVVTWWRPDGTRCCRTEYVHGSPNGKFTRFHENGEVSREGTMKNGDIVGVETWYRSTKETSEYFGVYGAGKKVWKAEVDHVSGATRLFDRKGALCDQKGKPVAAPAPRADAPSHFAAPEPSTTPAQAWEPPVLPVELVNGVWWTPGLRRVICPRRGGVATAIRPLPTLDVAWAALRRALFANDVARLAHESSQSADARSVIWSAATSEEAPERAFGERILDPKPRVGSPEEDAYLLSRFFTKYGNAILAGGLAHLTMQRATDFLAASVGLEETAARMLAGLDDELPYQSAGPFERLRELLVIADAATYASVRHRMMAALKEQHDKAREDRNGDRMADLAWATTFTLPLGKEAGDDERRVLDLALEACKGRGFGNDHINAGGLASGDAAALEKFISTNPRIRHEFFASGDHIYLGSILDLEGAAVAKTLAKMKPAPPFEDDEEQNGRWAFLLAHIDADVALEALVAEHDAGYSWGARALALAATFQKERVVALLEAKKKTDLLRAIETAQPLEPPDERSGDLDGTALPVYDPPPVKRATVRKSRFSLPAEITWRDVERQHAIESGVYDDAVKWNDKKLRDVSPEELERWIAHRERWALPTPVAAFSLAPAALHPRLVALGFAPHEYDCSHWLGFALLAGGEVVIPLLATALEDANCFQGALGWSLPLAHASMAPPILLGFAGKKHKAEARAWILRHPRHAWTSAIDLAIDGEKKTERPAAERVLRYLSSQGHRDAILADARSVGEDERVRAILDVDPLTLPKAKKPALPKFADPSALPPLERIDGSTLDAKERETLLVRLAVSNADEVHPGVLTSRAELRPASRATFAWALFEAWLAAKADPKQGWAMQAVGFLGDDGLVRKLTALAKDWPGEGASARAQAALDALLAIGTEIALVNINLLAEKSKYPAFKAAAAERVQRIADARGLTPDELQDRLVPTLGLDEPGALRFDYGPRAFDVSFDEGLAPIARDASGALLPGLPKPNKSDDAKIAKASQARFSALKKDARTTASLQIARLERAMQSERAIDAAAFVEHFVEHPWMIHLTRRLVWGVVLASGIERTFRVAEDGSFADASDDATTLPSDARVVVVHPLRIDAAALEKWNGVFADYELLQPFEQLSRPVFQPTADEAKSGELTRFTGQKVHHRTIRGLESRRWAPWIDSWIHTFSKQLGQSVHADLTFEPGWYPGGDEVDEQTLGTVSLRGADHFAALDPLVFSELVHDLASLGKDA